MGEVMRKTDKPLQVNPFRLTQPMGAALAFLGIDRCMPLMHGGMGCTSFTKVFLTRHFCEPLAIQTTAVTDVTAVATVASSRRYRTLPKRQPPA
jgi:nitrogenase molybdenum-iron protein NifN